ncbi:cobW-domain-containing protein [Patellaria atrata CBS 101060]|uniref:CobW-domain-containing protein n=1 Tax=Patellaria atrata CBS 101060 TaxID=1346257 RepID=A0A9P4S567_9PEZI|nr:cobW-domain-containing protein [Patellaria atrata CBS 101060]
MVATRSITKQNGVIKVKSFAAATEKSKREQIKALPVTLLSGFLGSGKTTLLQHVLRSDHGLRIAVIVNDIGSINVDASLIRSTHLLTKTEEKIVALQNGCICCTLRGDLLEELIRLSELAEFDYVIIESSGISEPEQVAETFDTRLAEQLAAVGGAGAGGQGLDEAMLAALERLKDAGGLEKFARLDTTVTVVDAFTIFNDFQTDELLSSRRDDVVPEDERTISDLMVDQIEFADVIVLNKLDMVSKDTKRRIKDLIVKLNHRAKVLESEFGKIEVKQIVNTGLFNMELAQTGYGWLQDLHEMTLREVNGKKMVTPKPETEEYNVRNFVYTRRRPFHPRRLFNLVYDKFILQQQLDDDEEVAEDEDVHMTEAAEESGEDEDEDDDDDDEDDEGDPAPSFPSNATILANKSSHPLFAKLFRSKGEIWLATRPDRAGEWSQAGAMLTLRGGRPWFCVTHPVEWKTGNREIDELVEYDMEAGGIWGDRRQELVFIGENLDIKGVQNELDKCLLDDKEWGSWQGIMMNGEESNGSGSSEREMKYEKLAKAFEDGFQDWIDDDNLEDHEGHMHEHTH